MTAKRRTSLISTLWKRVCVCFLSSGSLFICFQPTLIYNTHYISSLHIVLTAWWTAALLQDNTKLHFSKKMCHNTEHKIFMVAQIRNMEQICQNNPTVLLYFNLCLNVICCVLLLLRIILNRLKWHSKWLKIYLLVYRSSYYFYLP